MKYVDEGRNTDSRVVPAAEIVEKWTEDQYRGDLVNVAREFMIT